MTTRRELLEFNQRNRDAWVSQIASRLKAGTVILDLGAGPCRYRDLFAHCDYRAQDAAQYQGTNAGLLKDQWGYGQLDYVCDATAIPVAAGIFDAVLCTEVLEHVPDPVRVLQEIARILKIGGRVFISAPLGSGLHQQPYHFYSGFTPHFYRLFMTAFGMDIVSIEPNGRFFRLLLQEMHRGAGILWTSHRYPLWHPARWLSHVMEIRS